MTRKVDCLPWMGGPAYEGYSETRKAIDNYNTGVLETRHGAEHYLRVINRAVELMEFPEDVKVEEPSESAKQDADEFVDLVIADVLPDGKEGAGRALYGLISDVYDHADLYAEHEGRENIAKIINHMNDVRNRWRDNQGTYADQ